MLQGTNVFCNLLADILDPLAFLIFSLGFLVFLWGLVEFIQKSGTSSDTKEGKAHMLWGVIGMFIMVSVGGILNIIDGTFGFIPASAISCSSSQTQQTQNEFLSPIMDS